MAGAGIGRGMPIHKHARSSSILSWNNIQTVAHFLWFGILELTVRNLMTFGRPLLGKRRTGIRPIMPERYHVDIMI